MYVPFITYSRMPFGFSGYSHSSLPPHSTLNMTTFYSRPKLHLVRYLRDTLCVEKALLIKLNCLRICVHSHMLLEQAITYIYLHYHVNILYAFTCSTFPRGAFVRDPTYPHSNKPNRTPPLPSLSHKINWVNDWARASKFFLFLDRWENILCLCVRVCVFVWDVGYMPLGSMKSSGWRRDDVDAFKKRGLLNKRCSGRMTEHTHTHTHQAS